MDKRSSLDVAKGLLIIFVVVGHFGQTIANSLPATTAPIAQGIVLSLYAFHMPTFIFISGYLSQHVEKRRERAFVDLFIPYLMYQLLVGVAFLVLTKSPRELLEVFTPQMGGWYLLTLFTFRLLLPNLLCIKGVFACSIVLSVLRGCMPSIGDGFAMQWSVSFLPFFLAGYYAGAKRFDPRKPVKRILPAYVCVILLISTVPLFAVFCQGNEVYRSLLTLFTASAEVAPDYPWYTAICFQAMWLLAATVMLVCFFGAIPEKCGLLERIGSDTMPLYLSHLVLFMAIHLIIGGASFYQVLIVCTASAVLSIVVFSSEWYRNVFHFALGHFTRAVYKENQ